MNPRGVDKQRSARHRQIDQFADEGRTTGGSTPRGRQIQAVERAAVILETLATEPTGMGLADLSGRLSLAPQTVQSILRTLQSVGMIFQSGPKQPYTIGPSIPRLARTWAETRDRGSLAAPVVADLASEIGESVLLAELRGGQLSRLAEAQSSQILTVRSSEAAVGHLHAFATGKVLLAHLPEAELRRVVSRLRLPRLTAATIGETDELLRELRTVRRDGHAVSDEEVAEGTFAMAVPVHDSVTDEVAGLGVFLPKQRATESRRRELLAALHKAAREIAAAWRGAAPPSTTDS